MKVFLHMNRYTYCMSDTTIRVDIVVRDKLRALADEEHITLGDLLGHLADREQYQREMRRANEMMDQMRREEPAAFATSLMAPGLDYWVNPEETSMTVWDGAGSWAVVDTGRDAGGAYAVREPVKK